MLQLFDFFSGDSDEQRKQRARMAKERRAREGYGGGSGQIDRAYDPNAGTTQFGTKKGGYTEKIIAPRNGVIGAMEPNRPETWARLKGSDAGAQAGVRRYEQLGGDMSGIDARRMAVYRQSTGGREFPNNAVAVTPPVVEPVVEPVAEAPAPETVVESPGGGAGGGVGIPGVGPSSTETRVNQNNVTQTGRNLGKINLSLSAGVADFTGPSFPTQAASNQISTPYPNTTPGGLEKTKENFFGPYQNVLTQGYKQKPGELEGEPAEVPGSSVQLPRTETSSYETFDANDPRFADAFGEDYAKSLGGTSKYGDSGAETPKKSPRRRRSGDIRSRDIDARGGFDPRHDNRGTSDSYEAFKPADYATSSQEMARRAAFLSTPGGAREGMVAVKKGLGLVEEGRDNYALAGGELHKISPEHKRELLNTPQSDVDSWRADWYQTNVLNKKGKSAEPPTTGKANYTQAPPIPAQAQNPTVIPPNNPESPNVPGRKFGPGGLFQ